MGEADVESAMAIASAYTIPRVNLNVVKLHSEVNMVASGHSGLAARAHDLTSFTMSPSCTLIWLTWP